MTAGVLGAAALAYAERLNWRVFPCRGKVPAIKDGRGYLDATTDLETIRQWWRRLPSANIGVSCIGSGLFAIDINPRHGGDETLADMERKHGELPHTIRQLTGGGGEHILFRAPKGLSLRGHLGPGVELKHAGYVVIAPSIHPDTRRPYAWSVDHHPLEVPIVDPPQMAA